MPVLDIAKTRISVCRVLSAHGDTAGYALTPPKDKTFKRITTLDRTRDYVYQLQIHVFHTEEAADAFREGLLVAGDDSANSLVDHTPYGWAVLREIHWPLDDPDEPTIAVVTYDAATP